MIGTQHAHQDGYAHDGETNPPAEGMRDAVCCQHPNGSTTELDASKGIGGTADSLETGTNPVGSTSSFFDTSKSLIGGLFTDFFDPYEYSRFVYELNAKPTIGRMKA